MATKISADEGRKQKGQGMASGTQPTDRTRPPDRRKLDKSLAAIATAISERETKLKLVFWNPAQNLSAEIAKMTAELTAVEREKSDNTVEVQRIEDELQSLGQEVIEKKNEASTLIAGVRHKTEEKIDEAVSKLKLQLQTRQHSAPEERKIQQEITTLTNSKDRLRAYYQLKSEIEDMRARQEQLRKKRDGFYRANSALREKIGSFKDRLRDKRQEMDQHNKRKKEAISLKESIGKEIDELKQRKRQLLEAFRQQQLLRSQAATEERQLALKEEQKHSESRREERLVKIKHPMNHLPIQRPQYIEEKQVCNTLIAYTERLSMSHASSNITLTTSPSVIQHPVDQSHQFGHPVDKPGEFLRRKEMEEGDVLVPASSRKKSKRDKRRHTISSKAGKRLNHNATTCAQFSFLGLVPPYTSLDLPQALTQLQEKLTFYTSKSQSGLLAESEAGDSGVGSTAWDIGDPDLHTPLTTSQEDIPQETLSPSDTVNGLKSPTKTNQFSINDLAGQSMVTNNCVVPGTSSESNTATESSPSSSVAVTTANHIEE